MTHVEQRSCVEAMKQALKTLNILRGDNSIHWDTWDNAKANAAITSLRQAIAVADQHKQAEKQAALDAKADNACELGLDYEPVMRIDWWPNSDTERYIANMVEWGRLPVGTLLYTRPQPKAEQQPVAWRGLHPEDYYFYYDEFPDEVSEQARTSMQLTPLYTHPPVPQGHKPKAEQKPVKWSDYEYDGFRNKPVAWMDVDGNISDNNDYKCFPIPLFTHPQPKAAVPPEHKQAPLCTAAMFDDAFLSKSGLDPKTPLYTSPYVATPRQPQKPLTEEEADEIALDVMGFAVLDKEQAETARMLIRKTEAAHNINAANAAQE